MDKVVIDNLMNYGIMGIVMIVAFYYFKHLEKRRIKREDYLEKMVRETQDKITHIQKEHENFLKTEYVKSMALNERCLEVLEDVRDLIKKTA